ncbi:MAG: hypothetical protein F6K35_30685 [Okeania sp. SIO2H7]|nr:hypothetical protein [Okeania sp. SIO2H7]
MHFGVVASGEKVVADTSTIPELQGTWNKLIGVEMESFGVASAVDRLNSAPGMLMVKGICDWADSSKNDDWQAYAADVAAAYVINFLKCNSIGLGVEDGYLFKSQEEVKFTDILLESSGGSKGKQENLPDLDFSAIPPKSIQQAYRKAFAPDADLWEENDISQILERLKENKCEGAFYQLLSEDKNIDGSMRQKIQEKAKKYPQENKERQYERRESYLIATLKPVDDEFWLNGWLVTGEHQNYLDYLKNCESLLKDNPTESVIKCQLEEVESWLDNFIEQCFKFLPEDHQLIIEVFLPIDLLHTKVEWWNFTEFDYKKRPIGTEYSVRLRSVERLQRRYLDRHSRRWKEKWRRVKSVLEKPAILEHFGYFDSAKNCDFTEAYLINQLDDKIGVKLMSCPPKHKRQELFMAIMKSGLPIVLWSRYNLDNRDREIEQFFNLQRLCSLCDSIRKKRLEAFGELDEVVRNNHLGSHLAVIWENPYRLTPDLIELMLPGK